MITSYNSIIQVYALLRTFPTSNFSNFKRFTYLKWQDFSKTFLKPSSLQLAACCFFKILKFDPPRSIFDLFWPTFLNAVPFFFYLTNVFDFWYQSSSRCPLAPVFWIFEKYAYLPPWRTFDGFRFCQIAGFWHFLPKICTKCCAICLLFILDLRFLVWWYF